MKKNQMIMNRVEQYEYKKGIYYLKTDGKFYLTLKVLISIFFAWAISMNMLAVLSWGIRIGNESFKHVANEFFTLLSFGVLSIIGFVLIFTKLKAAGLIVSIVTSIFTIITYAPLLQDGTMVLGYKTIYFTRHFIPYAMVTILAILMFIVVLIECFKYNANYKRIEKNLYTEFSLMRENENVDITWEEYLNTIE